MDMTITYAKALKDYPKETAEAVDKLRKSRSKHRKANPATLKWTYSWGVTIQCHSFMDLLNGKAAQDGARRDAMSLQQRVQDEIGRTSVSVGVAGHYYARLPNVPKEIEQGVLEAHKARLAEEQRVAALNPAQQQAEANEALRKLAGGRGFTMVSF
jgi:uncharacterized lipoprotein YddW (UPF0748 family)